MPAVDHNSDATCPGFQDYVFNQRLKKFNYTSNWLNFLCINPNKIFDCGIFLSTVCLCPSFRHKLLFRDPPVITINRILLLSLNRQTAFPMEPHCTGMTVKSILKSTRRGELLMCIMTISILMGAAFIEVNTKGILHATFNPEADFFKQPLVSLIFVTYFTCLIHRFLLIVMMLLHATFAFCNVTVMSSTCVWSY
jgi:hypothetical protein